MWAFRSCLVCALGALLLCSCLAEEVDTSEASTTKFHDKSHHHHHSQHASKNTDYAKDNHPADSYVPGVLGPKDDYAPRDGYGPEENYYRTGGYDPKDGYYPKGGNYPKDGYHGGYVPTTKLYPHHPPPPAVQCSCPAGVANCGLCPKGFTTSGAASATGNPCKACPSGSTTSSSGATSCGVCEPGYGGPSCLRCGRAEFSTGGPAASTTCQTCDPGFTIVNGPGTSSADCIPDVCAVPDATTTKLVPIDLPPYEAVTVDTLPQCVTFPNEWFDWANGTKRGDCVNRAADQDFTTAAMQYYIPPAPYTRSLYAATCAMSFDGWMQEFETDPVIVVSKVDLSGGDCTLLPLFNANNDTCNDDFDSTNELMLCNSDDTYQAAILFDLPADAPGIITLMGYNPLPTNQTCDDTPFAKTPFTITFADVTNPSQVPNVVIPPPAIPQSPMHDATRRDLPKKANKGGKHGKAHHAEAELNAKAELQAAKKGVDYYSPAHKRPGEPVTCGTCRCPTGVGCGLCPVGTFASNAFGAVCSPCPAGSTSSKAGASSCDVCLPGYGRSDAGVCAECPAGTYSSGGALGNTTCQSCGNGLSSLAGSTDPSACLLEACAPRNMKSIDLTAEGGGYGLWELGKCKMIPASENPAECAYTEDGLGTWGPILEFMIEPEPTNRTVAITTCRMNTDVFVATDPPETVVQLLEVSDEATCALTQLDCDADFSATGPQPPAEAGFTCGNAGYLSYMETTIPANKHVVARMFGLYSLSCMDTRDIMQLALDVFDITNGWPGARKVKPHKQPSKSREQRKWENEQKQAAREKLGSKARRQQKRQEKMLKKEGQQGPLPVT